MAVLRAIWAWWKPVAHRLANFQAAVILSVLYFVLLGPFALGMKLGAARSRRGPQTASRWVPRGRPDDGNPAVHARRQF
jgi:hypothetical protein